MKTKEQLQHFYFYFIFLHKGYSGQISIECTNICKSKESLLQKGESIHDPYKQTFNIELATDAVSIYVWIEAIGKMDCLQISYFKAMQLKKSLPMRSYNSIICVFIGIPGRFDTNGFIMGTGSFSLTFYSKLDGITPQQLKNSLQVRSYKSLAV